LTIAREPRGPVSTEPRITGTIVGDTSASMFSSGALAAVTAAFPEFRAAVLRDGLLTRKLDWSILTFSDTPQVIYPYGPITEWEAPEVLEHGNGTAMGTAIIEGLRLQAEHIEALGEQGISLQHAFIFLITDGYPNNEPPERFEEAARLIEETERKLPFSFFSIGVEGADMSMLQRLTPRRTPLRLAAVNDFTKFFTWLNSSLRTVSMSRPGERIALPDPMKRKANRNGGDNKNADAPSTSDDTSSERENPIGWAEI
jgi:uncharacterized protein YegL